MTNNSDIVFPAAARLAQTARGSARVYEKRIAAGYPDRVTPDLAGFIAELDTAFLATVSAEGAPYIQHRGGPKGFIRVLDDKTSRKRAAARGTENRNGAVSAANPNAGRICNPGRYRTVLLSQLVTDVRPIGGCCFALHYCACTCGKRP